MHESSQKLLQELPLTTPLHELALRSPVATSAETPILTAVQEMTRADSSCLVVTGETGGIVGIFTDQDVRMRVVAAGRDVQAAVGSVMTKNPLSLSADAYAFQAMLMMSQHDIHHLPIVVDGKLFGIVTAADLINMQATTPIYLAGDVRRQNDVAGLIQVSRRLPLLVKRLVSADAQAEDIGRVVSLYTDALTARLLQLGEQQLGASPVPYAWLAFGSQARQEQTAYSDQDNALLLSNEATSADDDYFAKLAQFVNDGLDACGYRYCDGDVMANNSRWRQPLERWERQFHDWIMHPDPTALLNATIFFDVRHIAGDPTLTAQLKSRIIEWSMGNKRFLGNLANNALGFQPPLGFFGRIITENDTLDLKLRGVVPVTDLARVYALAHGVTAVNTFDRLRGLIPTTAFVPQDAHNLLDALEFIFYTRIQHQGKQLSNGQSPNNLIDPDALSPFEREHLKDAFIIVRKMQGTLSRRYQTGLMR